MIKSKGYSFFMETIYRLSKHGLKLLRFPFIFEIEKYGYSKIFFIEIFRTLKNLFILYFEK